jgi:hypothetical protein
MNPPALRASHLHELFQQPTLRHRAELPALTASRAHVTTHDFLVPILRPELLSDTQDCTEDRPFIEPDSIFWSPDAQTGDAA